MYNITANRKQTIVHCIFLTLTDARVLVLEISADTRAHALVPALGEGGATLVCLVAARVKGQL